MIDSIKPLLNYFREHGDKGIAIAFSGGVDSMLLVYAAKQVTDQVLAITFVNPLQSKQETAHAKKWAQEMGVEHVIIEETEIPEEVVKNTRERCYLCKKHLFEQAKKKANELGHALFVDGTNVDDLSEYRPGLRALEELGVKSPLRELGYTKKDVRDLLRSLGLAYSEKPSTPCLATRFPYDRPIDVEILDRLDRAEYFIRQMGFQNVRVRYYDGLVRMEVNVDDLSKMLQRRGEVIRFFKLELGFRYVTLDLEGFRSGSMDE